MTRLFVGIELPETVKASLLRLEAGIPGAHWQTADQLHLTVRFIGEVDGAVFDDVATALGPIDEPGFDVEVKGVGIFGTLKRARTLWAGIPDNPALNHLQEKIESALVRAGLAPETRKYHPHITLARLGNPSKHRLQDFLAANDGLVVPPFPVSHFTLFSSFVTNKGSIYTIEETFPLAGP
jgi:RNA 2',3'-cyclic 3'-phosphodiesterase